MTSLRNFAGVAAIVFTLASEAVDSYAQHDSAHRIDIVRLDPRFDKLVPFNIKIEKIAGGHKWCEGPGCNR